jgi:hypothetical protein
MDRESYWAEINEGVFLLNFNSNNVDQNYALKFLIRSTEARATYEHPIRVYVGSDFDLDNTPNGVDPDDDNDGYLDHHDALPFNPYEHLDTDGDGLGDEEDTDADNDGAFDSVDAYPFDYRCADATAGDGKKCYFSYESLPWFMDKNGVVYFEPYTAPTTGYAIDRLVARWNPITNTFLSPLRIPYPGAYRYSPATHKLYAYGGGLTQIDLNTGERSVILTERIDDLAFVEAGHFVITRSPNPSTESLLAESYDYSGRLISFMRVHQNSQRLPVYPSVQARYCGSYITTDPQGVLSAHFDDKLVARCMSFMPTHQFSLDGTKYYGSFFPSVADGIYAKDSQLLFSLDVEQSYARFWTSAGFVVANSDGFIFYDFAGNASKRFSQEKTEEVLKIVHGWQGVVLVTQERYTQKIRYRIFNENVELLSVITH